MRSAFFVCSPEIYDSEAVQNRILEARSHADHAWIFNIREREQILLDRPLYSLCCDKPRYQSGPRFLIIFHRSSLHALRDLRGKHAALLRQAAHDSQKYLKQHYPKEEWVFYFNYVPSVFQLHAHVCPAHSTRHASRSHNLFRVVRNIERDSEYYAKALILTYISRTNALNATLIDEIAPRIELDSCNAWTGEARHAKRILQK